ncbi:hypothetical protein ACL7TT_19605 [Microbulbifer sp. 2304DJ12-6]|uniref:hypothetical protein n=1 Tax=Microbulbifer sp. 2304DJ12-6 TaxID=3233340 RepID=UPI0039B10A0B
MAVTDESIENFQRGRVGDSFLGVVIYDPEKDEYSLHLALALRQDNQDIPNDADTQQNRLSRINGVIRSPLPGSGGHSQLVNWAGGQAVQIARGQAQGNAIGFSIIKDGAGSYKIGTYRSGFNTQHSGRRPGFATRAGNADRTLIERDIASMLSELNANIRTKHGRSHSFS